MMIARSLFAGILSLVGAGPIVAQEAPDPPATLDPILVEGVRLTQAETEAGTSVTVITSEDIRALGYPYAADVIATAPGVTINTSGAFGGVASIRIRGAASAQTLVLIDGVVVNDPSSPGGGYDFATLDTDAIERIEVLRGPQSTLWGSDAIGGVVSITTRRPATPFGGQAFAEYGSFNTIRGGAAIEGAGERGDFRIAMTGIQTDGISKADARNGNTEDDGYAGRTVSLRGGLALGGDAKLAGSVLWTDARAEFDSFDFSAQGNVGDGDEESETNALAANLALVGSLFDGQLNNLLQLGYSDIDRQNFFAGSPGFGAKGDRTNLRYQGTLALSSASRAALGIEREISAADGRNVRVDSLFGLVEHKPGTRLTLTGGLRVDDHERFGTQTTARLAMAFAASDSLTLRTSWGQGFKTPTLFQTTFFCCGASGPNADLMAETSEAFDAGLDWKTADGRVTAGLSAYHQDIDNLIDFSFSFGGYENIAKVETRGFEAYGQLALTDWLSLGGDYTYIKARDGSGSRLARLPTHSGDIRLGFATNEQFSGSVLVRYNGEERNSDGTTLAAWTRIDLVAQYELTPKVELFGRVENLFDEHYQQVLGYGTPGRSGSFGVRWRP